VRPDDAERFCDALEYIIRDEEKRLEMGERGRRFVEQHYSVERLVSDVQNLYEELLNPALAKRSGAQREAQDSISRVA
jgi:glycosyltransferase involved in cell wall biosynthesis